MSFNNRLALALVGALLAGSACSGNGTVPASPSGVGNSASQASNVDTNAALPAEDTNAALPTEDTPADSTSILKKLKKDVVIGSTVDPTNGDKGPRALSLVMSTTSVLKRDSCSSATLTTRRAKAVKEPRSTFSIQSRVRSRQPLRKAAISKVATATRSLRLTTCTPRGSRVTSLPATRRLES